jgi:hypothetical protein
MKKAGDLLFWLISGILLVVIVLRAYLIPITHDESDQILFYAQLPVRDIFQYTNPWPTNHIFNTLLIKFSTWMLGITQLSGRLPSIIFSVMSFVFVYKIARKFSPVSFIYPVLCLCVFLFDPFLFDFFGLARGYAFAVGFELGAFYFLLKYLNQFRLKDLLFLGVCLFLMVLSNFSWLILFVAIVITTGVVILYQKKYAHVIAALLILTGCSLIFYTPIQRMSDTHQFVFWKSNGFYIDTVVSIWNDYKYTQSFSLLSTDAWIVILYLPLILALIVTIRDIMHKRNSKWNLAIILLITTILVNIIQHELLGTPYLSTRTSLLYIPLYGFVIISLLARIQYRMPKLFIGLSFLIACVLSIHFCSCLNLKYAREWWYDQNTFDVLAIMQKVHEQEHIDVELNTIDIYNPSFNYYKRARDLKWLQLVYSSKSEPATKKCRFYYTNIENSDSTSISGYKLIMRYGYERNLYELENNNAKK